MPTEEGRALLAELREFATQPEFCYEHEWAVGDLIMWDNRSALHCAMGYDTAKHQRLMYRTDHGRQRALLIAFNSRGGLELARNPHARAGTPRALPDRAHGAGAAIRSAGWGSPASWTTFCRSTPAGASAAASAP